MGGLDFSFFFVLARVCFVCFYSILKLFFKLIRKKREKWKTENEAIQFDWIFFVFVSLFILLPDIRSFSRPFKTLAYEPGAG